MIKHKTIDNDELMESLCNDLNDAPDIRYLSISSHLYVEYYLNELIRLKFDEAKLIIDESELGSFNNKFLILQALGIFRDKATLISNINLLRSIRNFYAHNLLISNPLPEEVKSRIKQLKYMDEKGNETEYDVPWEEHIDPHKAQFHCCAFSAIRVLQELVWSLEGKKLG